MGVQRFHITLLFFKKNVLCESVAETKMANKSPVVINMAYSWPILIPICIINLNLQKRSTTIYFEKDIPNFSSPYRNMACNGEKCYVYLMLETKLISTKPREEYLHMCKL